MLLCAGSILTLLLRLCNLLDSCPWKYAPTPVGADAEWDILPRAGGTNETALLHKVLLLFPVGPTTAAGRVCGAGAWHLVELPGSLPGIQPLLIQS